MTNDYEQRFQERVDELLLLEQRVDRRAEKFIEITNHYQEKSQGALDDLLAKVGGIDESLAKMNAASDRVNAYVTHSATHATRTAKLFLGTVMACALIVAGTLWWSHHITSNLANAKAELASLNIKLQHKPIVIHDSGKDYIRIEPNTVVNLTDNDSQFKGTFAAIKYAK